jgi:HMG-box domain
MFWYKNRVAKKSIVSPTLSQEESKKDIIKRVAEEWRALSSRERANWDEIARDDKLR